MAGLARANFLIGGFRLTSTHITNRGANYSWHIPESAFGSPEASSSKESLLIYLGHGGYPSRLVPLISSA